VAVGEVTVELIEITKGGIELMVEAVLWMKAA
jgi:hypothetical protein